MKDVYDYYRYVDYDPKCDAYTLPDVTDFVKKMSVTDSKPQGALLKQINRNCGFSWCQLTDPLNSLQETHDEIIKGLNAVDPGDFDYIDECDSETKARNKSAFLAFINHTFSQDITDLYIHVNATIAKPTVYLHFEMSKPITGCMIMFLWVYAHQYLDNKMIYRCAPKNLFAGQLSLEIIKGSKQSIVAELQSIK